MSLKRMLKNSIMISTITITTILVNPQITNADTNNVKNIEYSSYSVGVVLPCDYLNVRTGPSTENSVITKVYTDNSVTILEMNSNGWVKIQINDGTQGWVYGKYLSVKSNTTQPQEVDQRQQQVNEIVATANAQLGKGYRWGSSGPNSFDCSGLTSYIYKNSIGVNLPRTSRGQANVGNGISRSELMPGDLVFFNTSGSGISHVGMYVGDSKFIHSPSNGKSVRYDNINSSYYSNRFVTAKRII